MLLSFCVNIDIDATRIRYSLWVTMNFMFAFEKKKFHVRKVLCLYPREEGKKLEWKIEDRNLASFLSWSKLISLNSMQFLDLHCIQEEVEVASVWSSHVFSVQIFKFYLHLQKCFLFFASFSLSLLNLPSCWLFCLEMLFLYVMFRHTFFVHLMMFITTMRSSPLFLSTSVRKK